MALNSQEILALYRRRAQRYDLAVWIYRLFGFRLDWYRKITVDALGLELGDTVIELGCGTGLNFPLLHRAVGSQGRIIGVDLTDAMLQVAEERITRAGWSNIELVRTDMVEYEFPGDVGGLLSTLAITLVEGYDQVIQKAAKSLRLGRRLAVFDLKEPADWPFWLIRLAAWMNRPFGVTLDLADRHPWESIRRHLTEIEFREFYFGALYLSVGEKKRP